MSANRRLQERKLPERIVLCKLGGEESSFVLNLSEDGLGFESHTPIEKTGVLQLRLSAEMNGTIETTGRLAWLDSAKRTGGLRFLELSAAAREKIRAWLTETSIPPMSEASTPSSETNSGASLQKYDKQAVERALPDKQPLGSPLTYNSAPDKLATCRPVPWQQAPAPSMQLVPIERHRAQKRRQFFAGACVGFGICAALVIAFSWFAGGIKLGSLPWTTASASSAAPSIVQQNHASPSAQRTQASAVQPFSPSPPIAKPAATKPLATGPEAMQTASLAAPTRSPQAQKQSSPSAGASPTNLLTRRSSPPATPQPAKPSERVASSRPSTKAEPLKASQAGLAPAPVASKASSSLEQIQHPKKVPPTPEQLWSALQKGNVKAAVALADLYARGEGVPQNCQQARVLLQAASKKHSAEATKKLQELDKNGCPANTAASDSQP